MAAVEIAGFAFDFEPEPADLPADDEEQPR
jgi:hypothetical protein